MVRALEELKPYAYSFVGRVSNWEDGWFEREFELALKDLEPHSTVGMSSLRFFGNTVESLLLGNPREGTACPDRVALLRQHVLVRLENPSLADPIRIFIKQEPHKIAKLEEGRLRLISAVSLVDTMTDRIMFGWLHRRVLNRVGATPVLVGWAPNGGGNDYLVDFFGDDNLTRGLDMTAWDWTVPGWLLLDLRDLIKSLAVVSPPWWNKWVDERWEKLFRDAEFVFADGTTTRQPEWGIMKSGCFLTIILNSFAQVIRHCVVCDRLNIWTHRYFTLGDDQVIEDFPGFHQYQEETRALGFKLKDSKAEEDIHFAGFVLRRGWYAPEYERKHVYRITHAIGADLPRMLFNYQFLYVYVDPWLCWVQTELAKLSPGWVYPKWRLKRIVEE